MATQKHVVRVRDTSGTCVLEAGISAPMRYSLLLILALAVLPILAFGRLGETGPELIARFGQPVSTGNEIIITQGKFVTFGSKMTFRQGDWTIDCVLIEGRCARVVYFKKGEWTEDQFRTVLTSNSQGERWTDISNEMIKKLKREWRRSDGASAIWTMGAAMTATHPAYERAKQRAEAKAKAEASQIPKI